MEGSEQDASIQSVEVHEAFEFEIGGGCAFPTVARRLRMEEIFGAAAKTRDVPGKTGSGDGSGNAIGEAFGKLNHVFEGGRREHVLERGAHGGK